MILPITLTIAGAAALINIWLGFRVGQIRTAAGISIGDGGNGRLLARMRAHANFTEYTPFVLILIGLIEYSRGTTLWLWAVGVVFIIARILHAFGMDGIGKARLVGTLVTMVTLLGLGLYAISIPYLTVEPTVTEITPIG